MRLVLFLAVALFATALPAGPASAEEVLGPTTIEADPGTTSGGVNVLLASDDVRVTVSEEDTTANLNALLWLRPSADRALEEWLDNNGEVCAGGSEFCLLDEVPVNDGNTTYIACATTLCDSEHELQDWSAVTDVTIDQVTAFVWAKQNASSETLAFTFRVAMSSPVASCVGIATVLTRAYANVSFAYVLDCAGGAWSTTDVSNTYFTVNTGATGTGAKVVTTEGIVVQYDDSDLAVVAYLNFTSLPGAGGFDYLLEYEGSTSLSGETLALQVDLDGTWTTIASPWLSSTEASGSWAVNPEAADAGAVRFRVVDSVTDEEAGESFALDVFRIVATPRPPGGPGPDVLRVSCEFDWPSMKIFCAADELVADPSAITVRAWQVDGEIVLSGANVSLRHAELPSGDSPYIPGAYAHTVRYRIWIDGVEIVSKPVLVSRNTTSLLALYLLVAIIAVAGIADRHYRRRTSPPPEPPRRSKE